MRTSRNTKPVASKIPDTDAKPAPVTLQSKEAESKNADVIKLECSEEGFGKKSSGNKYPRVPHHINALRNFEYFS